MRRLGRRSGQGKGGERRSPVRRPSDYNLDGTLGGATEPAVGGLATEMVSYKYNATGQLLSSQGTTNYLQDVASSRPAAVSTRWVAGTGIAEGDTNRITRH
ncbi:MULTISPECIES: hypothetical protein [Streptomyces]|uniref:hypothetical protein n=1 Tax=Streptomyces TaxID=1883 RepID=UPI00142D3DD7|nr:MULTISPECIES: hypothetical protein [Streptomyces]